MKKNLVFNQSGMYVKNISVNHPTQQVELTLTSSIQDSLLFSLPHAIVLQTTLEQYNYQHFLQNGTWFVVENNELVDAVENLLDLA